MLKIKLGIFDFCHKFVFSRACKGAIHLFLTVCVSRQYGMLLQKRFTSSELCVNYVCCLLLLLFIRQWKDKEARSSNYRMLLAVYLIPIFHLKILSSPKGLFVVHTREVALLLAGNFSDEEYMRAFVLVNLRFLPLILAMLRSRIFNIEKSACY